MILTKHDIISIVKTILEYEMHTGPSRGKKNRQNFEWTGYSKGINASIVIEL